MDSLLEQIKSARLPSDQHPSRNNLAMRETCRNYRAFTGKTKFTQLKEVSHSREKKKKREWHQFGHSRDSFSRLEKEHMDPSSSNWEKDHIHFLRRSYRHPPNFKGMLSQESKERFDEPNPELLASRYLPILQRQIEQSEDYELSPSKFGSTWVDEKRERIVPKLKITYLSKRYSPFSTQWRNDDFKYYKQTRSSRD